MSICESITQIHTFGRRRFGAADWAPDNRAPCRLDTGHLRAVSSYEEKTMKQVIS